MANGESNGKFDSRITLGNILTIITLLGSLVGGFAWIKTALETQGEALRRVELNQTMMTSKMDSWYERLVVLEERDRARRGTRR